MTKQTKLFDEENFYEEHWNDMPEFHQEDLTSYRKIIVHFRNDEDVEEFAKLVDQKITPKLPSLWFPKMDKRIRTNKAYIDES